MSIAVDVRVEARRHELYNGSDVRVLRGEVECQLELEAFVNGLLGTFDRSYPSRVGREQG